MTSQVVLFAIGGFLLGGAISVWRNQRTPSGRAMVGVLVLAAGLAIAAGVLRA